MKAKVKDLADYADLVRDIGRDYYTHQNADMKRKAEMLNHIASILENLEVDTEK